MHPDANGKPIALNLVKTLFIMAMFLTTDYLNRNIRRPSIFVNKQEASINFNQYFYALFNLGQKRVFADLLWIQTLLESDLDHYQTNDLNSWMYLRFDSITNLDVDFIQAYQFGGQYLSIIKDDKLGAKNIYVKGLARFPDDYLLNFHSGYHYLFEIDDPVNAARAFEKIKDRKIAPPFLRSLTARIFARNGDLAGAYQLMENTFKNEPVDSPFKKRYFESLNSIRIELDLGCLNSGNPHPKDCRTSDLKGVPYRHDGGGAYSYPGGWTVFRPKIRARENPLPFPY